MQKPKPSVDTEFTRSLTEKQRLYVHHLVYGKLSHKAAARAAGYRGNLPKGMTDSPRVMHAIAVEREEYAKASAMTKKKVIDGFMEAIDMARTKADPVAMIAGWREVGKMCGFYEPSRAEIKVSVGGQVMIQKLNSMTDEELLALAEGNPNVLDGEFSVVDK